MIIARVVGNVVATQKQESHEGKKILLVQPLDLDGQPVGDPFVALDAVDAGVGDRVLAVQEGFSAMTSVGHVESPIDAAVIGIVDLVEIE
jgi:ethanolamine utilization protein EutN